MLEPDFHQIRKGSQIFHNIVLFLQSTVGQSLKVIQLVWMLYYC